MGGGKAWYLEVKRIECKPVGEKAELMNLTRLPLSDFDSTFGCPVRICPTIGSWRPRKNAD